MRALLCLFFLASSAWAQTPLITGVTSLAALRNQARVLLIFAPRPNDPELEIQLRTLKQHGAKTSERDLLPIALPWNSPSPTAASLNPVEANSLRQRFGIQPTDFAVVLIGKDGSDVLHSRKPLSMRKLDKAIDAMPMRQQEKSKEPPH